VVVIKLSRLAAVVRATEFGRALAHRRVADRGPVMGHCLAHVLVNESNLIESAKSQEAS
jgi:hypothetical protein